jgi:hypothetical protein
VAVGARTALVLDAGLHAVGRHAFPSAAARLTRAGPLTLEGYAQLAGQARPVVAVRGFADRVMPLPTDAPGAARTVEVGAAAGVRWGALGARVDAYARQTTDALEYLATDTSVTVAAAVLPAPVRRVGATATLGVRADARRGLYATAQGGAQRLLDPAALPRLDGTLPTLTGRLRLGARFLLFRRDLVADLYVEGRGWTATRSRRFHAPTGLFALPAPGDAFRTPAGGTLDVGFEGRIRGATIFLGYANALAGTPVQPGITLVPIYPLLEQQFRFGVFWPILN